MSERVRFHLDEQVDPQIAFQLRRRGIDVTTTVEAGLRTQSDSTQLAFAYSVQRVLVTHDDDFLKMTFLSKDHFGIAYCKQRTRLIGKIIASLILIYEVYTPEDMLGRVEFL